MMFRAQAPALWPLTMMDCAQNCEPEQTISSLSSFCQGVSSQQQEKKPKPLTEHICEALGSIFFPIGEGVLLLRVWRIHTLEQNPICKRAAVAF